jgi:hypothetical protein
MMSNPRVPRADPPKATARHIPRSALLAVAVVGLFVATAALVGLSAATAASAGPAAPSGISAFSGTPHITLSSTSGLSATSIIVTGFHFPQGKVVLTFVDPLIPTYNLDGARAPYNHPTIAHASATGHFSVTLYLPTLNAGVYDVQAVGGAVEKTAQYTVTMGGTTLTVHPTSIAPGGCVVLKGTNFYPGDVENFYIGPWSNTAGYKTLKSFGDALSNGAIDHHMCFKSTVYLAGTYGLLVVGDTFGTGTVTLTIT